MCTSWRWCWWCHPQLKRILARFSYDLWPLLSLSLSLSLSLMLPANMFLLLTAITNCNSHTYGGAIYLCLASRSHLDSNSLTIQNRTANSSGGTPRLTLAHDVNSTFGAASTERRHSPSGGGMNINIDVNISGIRMDPPHIWILPLLCSTAQHHTEETSFSTSESESEKVPIYLSLLPLFLQSLIRSPMILSQVSLYFLLSEFIEIYM